jgi:hypothetical protein
MFAASNVFDLNASAASVTDFTPRLLSPQKLAALDEALLFDETYASLVMAINRRN